MKKTDLDDYLWIASEVCYYLGLVLFALAVPALAIILWLMSLVGKAQPNYGYVLIAWLAGGLMFWIGVALKNRLIK